MQNAELELLFEKATNIIAKFIKEMDDTHELFVNAYEEHWARKTSGAVREDSLTAVILYSFAEIPQ